MADDGSDKDVSEQYTLPSVKQSEYVLFSNVVGFLSIGLVFVPASDVHRARSTYFRTAFWAERG